MKFVCKDKDTEIELTLEPVGYSPYKGPQIKRTMDSTSETFSLPEIEHMFDVGHRNGERYFLEGEELHYTDILDKMFGGYYSP